MGRKNKGLLRGIIEADETYVGGKPPRRKNEVGMSSRSLSESASFETPSDEWVSKLSVGYWIGMVGYFRASLRRRTTSSAKSLNSWELKKPTRRGRRA